jgi:hypothetical protein
MKDIEWLITFSLCSLHSPSDQRVFSVFNNLNKRLWFPTVVGPVMLLSVIAKQVLLIWNCFFYFHHNIRFY